MNTREQTLKEMAVEHYQKFEEIAQAIGVSRLTHLVPLVGYKTLEAAYAADKNLNTVPLKQWDERDFIVRRMVDEAPREKFCAAYHKYANYAPEYQKTKIWSLSDTVCVLKHVAIYHIIGVEAPTL